MYNLIFFQRFRNTLNEYFFPIKNILISSDDTITIKWIINQLYCSIELKKIKIIIHTKEKISFSDLPHIDYQKNINEDAFCKFVKFKKIKIKHFFEANLIFTTNPTIKISNLFFLYKTFLIDRNNDGSIAVLFKNLNWYVCDRKLRKFLLEKSKKNFKDLKSKLLLKKNSLILLTGPSLDHLKKKEISEKFITIGVNDIIKKNDLMDKISLNILCFTDPNLFFGASNYAVDYYQNLKIFLKKHKETYIFIEKMSMPYVNIYLNEFIDRIIGIERINKHDFSYNIPNLNNFFIKIGKYQGRNIATSFAIPIAASFSKNIYVVGADGINLKNINNNYEMPLQSNDISNEKRFTVLKNYPSQKGKFQSPSPEETIRRQRHFNNYYSNVTKFLKSKGISLVSIYPTNYTELKYHHSNIFINDKNS